jgi:hypothetical protein
VLKNVFIAITHKIAIVVPGVGLEPVTQWRNHPHHPIFLKLKFKDLKTKSYQPELG